MISVFTFCITWAKHSTRVSNNNDKEQQAVQSDNFGHASLSQQSDYEDILKSSDISWKLSAEHSERAAGCSIYSSRRQRAAAYLLSSLKTLRVEESLSCQIPFCLLRMWNRKNIKTRKCLSGSLLHSSFQFVRTLNAAINVFHTSEGEQQRAIESNKTEGK